MREDIVIIGGRFGGSEAAWQAANRGPRSRSTKCVRRRDRRAHKTGDFGGACVFEFTGSVDPLNAPGILKTEMRHLNSLRSVLPRRRACRPVSTGGGSRGLRTCHHAGAGRTPQYSDHSRRGDGDPIRWRRDHRHRPALRQKIVQSHQRIDSRTTSLFFDAISPIIDAESINMDIVYRASRYGKGGATI